MDCARPAADSRGFEVESAAEFCPAGSVLAVAAVTSTWLLAPATCRGTFTVTVAPALSVIPVPWASVNPVA